MPDNTSALSRLLTYDETAAILQVDRRFVERLVASGTITPTRLGIRSVRFTEAEIQRYIDSKTANAPEAIDAGK